MAFSRTKQLSISLGLYKPARLLHRMISAPERKRYFAYRCLYSNLFQCDDRVFDVGANIGNMTQIMLSLGAKVVAFEPQPACVKEIVARDNGKLTVVGKAMGSEFGTASLHLKSSTAIASLVPDWGGETSGLLTVPLITLDLAIEEFGEPAFCKIDVEGFEHEVLKGLSRPLKGMSLEYHCDERGISTIRSCVKRLLQLGEYKVNFTAYEDGELVLPQWMGAREFLKVFPERLGPIAYGDLFFRKI